MFLDSYKLVGFYYTRVGFSYTGISKRYGLEWNTHAGDETRIIGN